MAATALVAIVGIGGSAATGLGGVLLGHLMASHQADRDYERRREDSATDRTDDEQRHRELRVRRAVERQLDAGDQLMADLSENIVQERSYLELHELGTLQVIGRANQLSQRAERFDEQLAQQITEHAQKLQELIVARYENVGAEEFDVARELALVGAMDELARLSRERMDEPGVLAWE